MGLRYRPERQIHRNKPRRVDGWCILPGDPLRVNGAKGEGTETPYMGYHSNEKMNTYDSFNSMGKPTTPKAMWTETLGPGSARQGWDHRP